MELHCPRFPHLHAMDTKNLSIGLHVCQRISFFNLTNQVILECDLSHLRGRAVRLETFQN